MFNLYNTMLKNAAASVLNTCVYVLWLVGWKCLFFSTVLQQVSRDFCCVTLLRELNKVFHPGSIYYCLLCYYFPLLCLTITP